MRALRPLARIVHVDLIIEDALLLLLAKARENEQLVLQNFILLETPRVSRRGGGALLTQCFDCILINANWIVTINNLAHAQVDSQRPVLVVHSGHKPLL